MELYNKNRDSNIDLIKVIACIGVVGLHTQEVDTSIINTMVYYLCGFSVPAFFMCTGFFVLSKSKISIKYAYEKCKSILLIIVLWNSIAVCLMAGIENFFNKTIDQNIVVLFLKEVLGCLFQKGLLWQFWYLGALAIIYVLISIFSKYMKEINKKILIWIVLVLICTFIQAFSILNRHSLQQEVVQTLRIWTWGQYFFLGWIMRFIIPKTNKFKKRIIFLFVLWCVCDVTYQIFVGEKILGVRSTEYFYDSFITIIWLVLFFSVIYNIKLSDRTKVVAEKFSELSLGVYIVHPMVIGILRKIFEFSTPVEQGELFILTIVGSVFCVWIMKKIKVFNCLVQM